MHKGVTASQCQNARHLEAAEQTKDGCTNVHIHRAFLLSPSLQAIHLLVLLSLYFSTSILGLFCTGTHCISSQGKKKVMGRCNHNNLATQYATFHKQNTFFLGG